MSLARQRKTREAFRARFAAIPAPAVPEPDEPVLITTDGPATITVTPRQPGTWTGYDDDEAAMVAAIGEDTLFAVGLLKETDPVLASQWADRLVDRYLAGAL